MRRLAPALLLVATLTGCASLPAGAPTSRQVTMPREIDGKPIQLIDIASGYESAPRSDALPDWRLVDTGYDGARIRTGDRLTVTIYEIGYGLFSPLGRDGGLGGSSAPEASGRSLPVMVVPEGGAILIPYVGAVAAEGRTHDELAREIARRLRGQSQNAQVVVSGEQGPGHGVIVGGDIKTPGRVLLTSAGERLLDVVAIAGGPEHRPADTIVTLTRGETSVSARLSAIAPDGRANVRLLPGDRIALSRDARSLTVLGAAQSVAEIPFEADRLMLSEAVARAGGPLDNRADLRGIFVFRYVDTPDGEVPTIFRLDLSQPTSFFAAQRFQMQPRDVVLIANSRSDQIGKFIQMINQLTSPVVTVDVLTR